MEQEIPINNNKGTSIDNDESSSKKTTSTSSKVRKKRCPIEMIHIQIQKTKWVKFEVLYDKKGQPRDQVAKLMAS